MQQRIINILFGVIVVMLTGTVVYLTFGNKSTPVTDTTLAPVKTTTTQAPTTQNQNYLTIKEWGVQFEKPEALTDLRYEIFDNTGDTVAFITQQLINLDKSTGGKYCVASEAPIGLLSRVRNFDSFNQYGRYNPTNVQIGDYYYYFTGPQAACSDNKQVQTLTSGQLSALQVVILKSLKVASDETADWKTYANDKLGFNFEIPKGYDVLVDPIKYSENGNKYDALVIYDVALQDASIKWQDKNQDPHSGIFPTRATMVCNSDQEFFLNEDVLIENIATKKQILSPHGAVILEAEKSILKNGELSMRIYKYIDGDTGMQQIVAYWDNNKMYCTFSPELSQNENLSNQQKQQRISEWEKILPTFEFKK